MSATLDDVVKIMQTQSDKQDDTTSAISALTSVFRKKFLKDDRGAPDRLEAEREAKKAGGDGFDLSKIMAIPGLDALNSSINSLMLIGANFAKMILGITAGIAGFLAALAGIRGWELDAIKNIKSIGTRLRGLFPVSIATRIGDAMDLLRVSVARFFGIDPMNGKLLANGSRVGPKGFIPKVEYAKGFTQIIGEAFDLLRSSILTKFGIDPATGKMLKLTGDAAEDASPIARVIGRIGIQINSLFRPVRSFASAIGGFFKSDVFKGITKFVGSGGKAILAIFKKVFLPIGLVFSAFEGIKSFMESDAETIIGKLGEGVGGFVGDFIGAPFDLLKKGIAWIMENWLGFDEDSEAMKMLKGFKFADLIKKIVAGPFQIIEAGYLFIKDLFTDPKKAFENLWTNLGEAFPFSFATYLFDNLIKPAWDFVTGIFKQDPESENALGMSMGNVFSGVKDLFAKIGNFLASMGDFVALQAKFEIKAVINAFKNAFDRVATFFKNLGDNLYIILSKNLQFNFPEIKGRVPDWLPDWLLGGTEFTVIPGFSMGFGDESTRAAAQARIDTNNASMMSRIDSRNSETAEAFEAAQAAKSELFSSMGMQPIIINQGGSTVNNSANNSRIFNATGGATDRFSLSQQVQP